MRSTSFSPCLPTSGKAVPDRPNWLHEIKYDGYRLLVVRDGDRVRLITRGGYKWADRYPRIVESALKNRRFGPFPDYAPAVSFDDIVSACEERSRQFKANRFGRPKVD